VADLVIDTRTAVGAVGSCKVTIEPTDVDGTALAVFDGDGVQVRRLSSRTDSTGTLTLDVTPSSEVIGAGRYYTVTITDSDGGEWTFLIEKSTSTQTLLEALVVDPDELGLAVGLDNLVDGDTAVRTTDGRLTDARRPLPLGARMMFCGHSIPLGTGSTLSGSGNNGGSRQAVGGYPSRLCGQYSDRYYKLGVAAVGGDYIGGLGTLTAAAGIGATSCTFELTDGLKPYVPGAAYYIGGYASGEGRTAASITDNGDGTYTLTGMTALTAAHAAGAEVGWGMHGRLQSTVLDWSPETIVMHTMTNDSDGVAAGTITAAQAVAATVELGTRGRTAGAETLFLEELPRDNNQAAIAAMNDELRYQCRRVYNFHLVPLYALFAGSDGGWADSTMRADAVHPSDLGHERIAQAIHTYLVSVPFRVQTTPLAAFDTTPATSNNLITHPCFVSGTGGVGEGATFTPFVFAGTSTPSLVAPGATDFIIGQWQRITNVGVTGNGAIDIPVTPQHVGDLIYLAARVRTGPLTGGAVANVLFLTGGFAIDLGYQISGEMDLVLSSTITRLSSVASSAFRIQLVGGSGYVDVAQPLMQNLTTLGRAA